MGSTVGSAVGSSVGSSPTATVSGTLVGASVVSVAMVPIAGRDTVNRIAMLKSTASILRFIYSSSPCQFQPVAESGPSPLFLLCTACAVTSISMRAFWYALPSFAPKRTSVNSGSVCSPGTIARL